EPSPGMAEELEHPGDHRDPEDEAPQEEVLLDEDPEKRPVVDPPAAPAVGVGILHLRRRRPGDRTFGLIINVCRHLGSRGLGSDPLFSEGRARARNGKEGKEERRKEEKRNKRKPLMFHDKPLLLS